MSIQARLKTIAPSVPEETLPIREKLTVARDYALSRAADWHDWPENLQTVHALVAFWCGRAALSPWPQEDLEQATDAARQLLTGTLILRRLGDKHGFV